MASSSDSPAPGDSPTPGAPSDNGGIPDEAEGTLPQDARVEEFDTGSPPGPTPPCDFWDALYQRRSIRKFKPDPVPRELIDQLMHAGIWAPSSCNYQMWDLVAVDDPEVNAKLAALSTQMGNAPVNIVVSYGRDFSEEGWANVQSASALIQNISLAAQVLGLGTFWITQMGDREKVREIVGLPYDRLVIAVLAVGFPKRMPTKGPKRRPLSTVTHWNHYAGRAIPSSTKPADWPADLLAVYQRARVLNGLRHNKPRAWEVRALDSVLERWVPAGREKPAAGEEHVGRWLDVLPCTGILTDRLSKERRGYRFDVVERSPEVAAFCANRTVPKAGVFAWPEAAPGFDAPERDAYDLVTCFFRLEDVAPGDRAELVRAIASWVRPGGEVLIGFVSRRSYHDWTERARARRGGPGGVEYVLSPDPNIGPFESLDPADVERMCSDAGLSVVDRLGLQAVPSEEEIAFRTRNFSERGKKLVGGLAKLAGAVEKLPGVQSRRGRFRFLRLRRG